MRRWRTWPNEIESHRLRPPQRKTAADAADADPNNEEADFAFAFGPSTLANKVGLGEERSFTGIPNKACPRLRDLATAPACGITQPRTILIREASIAFSLPFAQWFGS